MKGLRIAAAGLATTMVAGCGFSAYSLPLPGGAATGKTYTVSAYFDDVEDLVPQNAVRVNDVAVGDITKIQAVPQPDGKVYAKVTMKIRRSVHLPANSVATLEQTTLLGEKYVSIEPPSDRPAQGTLQNGATIAEASTSDLPDVEEVFGILSQVLNGGGLQNIETINVEVTKALAGREQEVRGALKQLDTFVSSLDTQKAQIVRALQELARFSNALAQQTGTIGTALDELPAGLRVLADERAQFTDLLTKLSTFGRVASHVITASREQTVTDFRDLQPILHHLAAAGTNLPHALEVLVTFPFPKSFVNAAPGDYAGLRLTFTADPVFCAILGVLGSALPGTCPSLAASGPATTQHKTGKTATSGTSSGAGSSGLPGIVKKLVPTPTPSIGGLLGDLTHGLSGAAS